MVAGVLPLEQVVSTANLSVESVLSAIRTKRSYNDIQVYGKGIELPNSVREVEQLTPGMFKYIKAAQVHAQHIVDNVFSLLVQPMFDAASRGEYSPIAVKHGGLSTYWSSEHLTVAVRESWIAEQISDRVESFLDRYSRTAWQITDFYSRPNPNDSLLIESYNQARKRLIHERLSPLGVGIGSHYYTSTSEYADVRYMNMTEAITLLRMYALTADVRPTAFDVNMVRSDIVRERAFIASQAANNRHDVSMQNFQKYWEDLKSRKRQLVDLAEVRASFDGVPILTEGTRASRTWGIEIETVQAQLTSRPPGWDQRHDGSLETLNGGDCTYDYCECGCDDCDNGDHDDCYSDGEGQCAEFVSPILSHFNSNGLRQLCNDIGDAECNTSPGIHVHVGAGDLSASDIARLVRLYSIVSPFLWPLTQREVFGYCKDVSTRNIAHWLSIDRNIRKNGSKVSVQDALYSQPDDRYHDLNIQAYNAHGTIEFRAMGPVYNYKHLVRWAWLCRELVNLSKLDLPDELWRNVGSMADVLNIVYQYGSEVSESMISPTFDVNDLVLGIEYTEESKND